MSASKFAPIKIVDLFLATRLAHVVGGVEKDLLPRSFEILDVRPDDGLWITPDADYRRLVRIKDYPKLFEISEGHKLYSDLKYYMILIEQLDMWQNAVSFVVKKGIRKERKYPMMMSQFLQAKGYAMGRMLAFLYDHHQTYSKLNDVSMIWIRGDGTPFCASPLDVVINKKSQDGVVKKRSAKRKLPSRAAKNPRAPRKKAGR